MIQYSSLAFAKFQVTLIELALREHIYLLCPHVIAQINTKCTTLIMLSNHRVRRMGND